MLTFYDWILGVVELGTNEDATLAADYYLALDTWLF